MTEQTETATAYRGITVVPLPYDIFPPIVIDRRESTVDNLVPVYIFFPFLPFVIVIGKAYHKPLIISMLMYTFFNFFFVNEHTISIKRL